MIVPPPGFVARPPKSAAEVHDNRGDKKEEPKLTIAEWRNLLLSKPTHQNAYEFLKAYRQGDVDAESYYKIMAELLKNPGAEQEDAALYTLSNDSSGRAFAMLVTELPTLSDSVRVRVKSIVDDFAQPAKFQGLAKALLSEEPTVLKEVLRLLTTAVQAQDRREHTNDRESRGIASPVVNDTAFFFQPDHHGEHSLA